MRIRELLGELVMFKNYPAAPTPDFNDFDVKIKDQNGVEYQISGVTADWNAATIRFLIQR